MYVGRRIEKEGAARLRSQKLITGKFPKVRIASFLGEASSDPEFRQKILQQQDMSTETYIAHIKDILRDGHPRSLSEIMQAIAPYLSTNYNQVSMEHKLSNILNKMRKEETISVQGGGDTLNGNSSKTFLKLPYKVKRNSIILIINNLKTSLKLFSLHTSFKLTFP